MYECQICKTKHDNPEDAIDCHIACLLPQLRKLYSYVKDSSDSLKLSLIKERKQEVLKYSKLQTDLLIQEDKIKILDNKIQELIDNGKA